jgi:hypothetical protein
MPLYASYVCANSPDKERNPKQCEEPLLANGMRVSTRGYERKHGSADPFAAVQLLMRHEGRLVGCSNGSALAGALACLRLVARSHRSRENTNSLRNYIGKDWFLWFLDTALGQEPLHLHSAFQKCLIGQRVTELTLNQTVASEARKLAI